MAQHDIIFVLTSSVICKNNGCCQAVLLSIWYVLVQALPTCHLRLRISRYLPDRQEPILHTSWRPFAALLYWAWDEIKLFILHTLPPLHAIGIPDEANISYNTARTPSLTRTLFCQPVFTVVCLAGLMTGKGWPSMAASVVLLIHRLVLYLCQ